MTAFNANTFAYSSYATARPDYPPSLYNLILSYHHGNYDMLLDLGCGHGTVTRALAPRFVHATGADPSEGMLKEAARMTINAGAKNINFVQGTAESIGAVKDGSVDLVVAGQAAHWFPYPPTKPNVWDEVSRVVKPGGSVAFWCYSDTLFPESSYASSILHKWAYGHGMIESGHKGMGSYWSFPGRSRVEALFGNLVLPDASQEWEDVQWVRNDRRNEYKWYIDVENVGGDIAGKDRESGVSDVDRQKVKMQKTMPIGHVKQFLRTWSAYHNWSQQHASQRPRVAGGEGDVVDWAFDEIAEQETSWKDEGYNVLVEWPVGMLLIRRKRVSS